MFAVVTGGHRESPVSASANGGSMIGAVGRSVKLCGGLVRVAGMVEIQGFSALDFVNHAVGYRGNETAKPTQLR